MHRHQDQDAEQYAELLAAELVDQAHRDVGLDQALGDVGLGVLLAVAAATVRGGACPAGDGTAACHWPRCTVPSGRGLPRSGWQ